MVYLSSMGMDGSPTASFSFVREEKEECNSVADPLVE
jgi:hypothetical protein